MVASRSYSCLLFLIAAFIPLLDLRAEEATVERTPPKVNVIMSPARLTEGTICSIRMTSIEKEGRPFWKFYRGEILEANEQGIRLHATREGSQHSYHPGILTLPYVNRYFRSQAGSGRVDKKVWLPTEFIETVDVIEGATSAVEPIVRDENGQIIDYPRTIPTR